MASVYTINDPWTLAQATIVRRRESSPAQVNDALKELGGEVARCIAKQFFIKDESITTPLDHRIEAPSMNFPLTVAITPKEDLKHFAFGMLRAIGNCELGWMNFEGRRGLDALNTPVRDMSYPDLAGQAVDTLVVAKATLATGCTAVSLTRTAYRDFMPTRLVIASVFYTIRGLKWLQSDFPNAHIFVVGKPDSINDGGMLVPGIGDLAERAGGYDE